MDHCNLEYCHNARQLNPQQARWALFFTKFQFSVTYRPGKKNGKADSLSWRHDPASALSLPEPILPPSVIVAPFLVEEIQQAQVNEHPPPTCHLPSYMRSPRCTHKYYNGELHRILCYLYPDPDEPATPHWTYGAPAYSPPAMVPYGFVTDLPSLGGYNTILVGSFHQGLLTGATKGSAHSHGNSHNPIQPGLMGTYGLPEDIVLD
ncbi:hypothetical protein QTP86_010957 [Hemibagrus guttatus]|nr:hypothetical protein QTP86_010957 [Hemibagrus guttatus]